jgi:hypothetical protein
MKIWTTFRIEQFITYIDRKRCQFPIVLVLYEKNFKKTSNPKASEDKTIQFVVQVGAQDPIANFSWTAT